MFGAGPDPAWLVAGGIVLWVLIVAAVGGWLTVIDEWYFDLRKPGWKPPDWAFGPIWTSVFLAFGISTYITWQAAPDGTFKLMFLIALIINGALNVLWNLCFFTWKRPDWALIESYPFWVSILALFLLAVSVDVVAGILLLPYLLWVLTAIFLNRSIVNLNQGRFGAQTQS